MHWFEPANLSGAFTYLDGSNREFVTATGKVSVNNFSLDSQPTQRVHIQREPFTGRALEIRKLDNCDFCIDWPKDE